MNFKVTSSVTQVLAEAAVMTEQKPGTLETAEGWFSRAGGWKSRIKGLAHSVNGEGPFSATDGERWFV